MDYTDKKELISVIVPIYNVERYLPICIKSILNQSYRNIEVILVDDGSTDSSGYICDSFATTDPRVSVIHKQNGGLSDARNVGIKNSNGSFISLIDSDDVICDNFIQKLYEICLITGSDLVCCELICFYDEDENKLPRYWKQINETKCTYKKYTSKEITEKSFYQHISITGAPQKLYKKSLFDNIEFPRGRYFEDLATTYLFFEKANSISVIDQKLYAYRMRTDSIMNRAFNANKLDCIWVAEKIVSYYAETDMDGMFCAAFRVNRLVYDQIPYSYKNEKNKVWNEIKKYRWTVLVDVKAKKYERLLAALSFTGQYLFDFWLMIFRRFRKIMYRSSL
ncbi:MAG: glycosyltransferase family 2 protein [Lachnospiraceae bacterium]|nr:glycosyltransferase family 2 protein [Lachnospiraceae bacterium]